MVEYIIKGFRNFSEFRDDFYFIFMFREEDLSLEWIKKGVYFKLRGRSYGFSREC